MVIAKLHNYLWSLSRKTKSLILVFFDFLVLELTLWLAYVLRFADWWPEKYLVSSYKLFIIIPVLSLIIFLKLGLYRAIVRFFSTQAVLSVCKGVCLVTLIMYGLGPWVVNSSFPRSVPINFALIALILIGGSRLLIRQYYQRTKNMAPEIKPVVIYGAGSAGVDLAISLQKTSDYKIQAYIDDESGLWGRSVNGIYVHSIEILDKMDFQTGLLEVLVAIPSLSSLDRRSLLNRLAKYPVKVKVLPSMLELLNGHSIGLREVQLEDLLGRDPVCPVQSLIDISLKEKSIMITGAGGSIGKELARQVVESGANTVVLFERSEYALYSINAELHRFSNTQTNIVPIMGSVLDEARLKSVISRYAIQVVYHAAAYKHVPLVEHNVSEGIRNNILGTKSAALSALETGVERFVLISTDKAVRPTNVMGATKRAAELVLQNLSQKESSTIFSMVRFGNVLGSSGSVVPLFNEQIKKGGPVTVTHKDINRYFMSIPEAASLVIQAGSMAKGGEVFVLDMGEVVRIADLASSMINLMGYSVKSVNNPNGDIEIEYTGLRPGEKLYEELLIDDDVSGTEHPKIMMANEQSVADEKLSNIITQMEAAVDEGKSLFLRALLQELVVEYHPEGIDVDLLNENVGAT